MTDETAVLEGEEVVEADSSAPVRDQEGDSWAERVAETIRRLERAPEAALALAGQQKERDDAFLALRGDVRIIGDMLVDISKRLESVEANVAQDGARARGAWSQRSTGVLGD